MKSYDAVNITAPFKEAAFDKAKLRSHESELIGAANILVKTTRGLSCFNSDCTAVRTLIENFNSSKGGRLRNVLVVGCGGAGKAAAVAAFMLGLDVTLMNRNIARALTFVHHISSPKVSALPIDRFWSEIFRHDAMIYTLPTALDSPPFSSEIDTIQQESQSLKLIIEANYRDPAFTPEILGRLPQTVEYIPGEQWLLQQALTGYGLMTGINPNQQALENVFSRGTVIENNLGFDKF